MAKDHLIMDKTEIIADQLLGNQWRKISARADRIKAINFDIIETRKFIFLKGTDEVISIEASPMPIKFFRSKEKGFFDGYKTQLEKFAKDNRITIHDNTK